MLVTMHGHSLVLNLYIRFEQKNIRTHIYIHIFVGHCSLYMKLIDTTFDPYCLLHNIPMWTYIFVHKKTSRLRCPGPSSSQVRLIARANLRAR
jgi:hypothetical protein